MIGRRFISFLNRNPAPASSQPSSSSAKLVENEVEGKTRTWGRRMVSGSLICLTGGVALSALDDLANYGGCSRCWFCNVNHIHIFGWGVHVIMVGLGASVLSLGEGFIKRMPFVRHIYNASKQISAVISPDQNTQAFKEVAIITRIVEYAFGFITSSLIRTFNSFGFPLKKKKSTSVPKRSSYFFRRYYDGTLRTSFWLI